MTEDMQRLRRFAKKMRSAPTEAELRLWGALRGRRLCKLKFRRQVPLHGYIADFVCLESKLIVEIDGSQHADNRYDQTRDTALTRAGFKVVRFWNDDVLRDLDNVCQHILTVALDQNELN